MTKTIVITGPESVGKTSLTKDLAEHFAAEWIPEYARTYVEQLDRPYTYADVEKIAKKQLEQFHDAKKSGKKLVIFDTFLIITRVWFLHMFNREPDWLENAIKTSEIDLFLLCKPNIAWESDAVRENPNNREFLYNWYKTELEHFGKKFVEIDAVGNERLQQAIEAVEKLVIKSQKISQK